MLALCLAHSRCLRFVSLVDGRIKISPPFTFPCSRHYYRVHPLPAVLSESHSPERNRAMARGSRAWNGEVRICYLPQAFSPDISPRPGHCDNGVACSTKHGKAACTLHRLLGTLPSCQHRKGPEKSRCALRDPALPDPVWPLVLGPATIPGS